MKTLYRRQIDQTLLTVYLVIARQLRLAGNITGGEALLQQCLTMEHAETPSVSIAPTYSEWADILLTKGRLQAYYGIPPAVQSSGSIQDRSVLEFCD